MKVVYATPFSGGANNGHSVRGKALMLAGQRAGINVIAYDPPLNWQAILATSPDLILSDILGFVPFSPRMPIWVVTRWVPKDLTSTWKQAARVIAIEPLAEALPGVTHTVQPVVNTDATFRPTTGQQLASGYNTYWESVLFGYRDQVTWIDSNDNGLARVAMGGEITVNGADEIMEMIKRG